VRHGDRVLGAHALGGLPQLGAGGGQPRLPRDRRDGGGGGEPDRPRGRGAVALARQRRLARGDHPAPVARARDDAALGEVAERQGDRRTAAADDPGQRLVGELQRDVDAERRDAAPAVGEVPEGRLEAVLHARQLGDRGVHGAAAELAAGAFEQAERQAGPEAERGLEAVVEQRDAGCGRHDQAQAGRERLGAGALEEDHVAGAEQLLAGAAAEADLLEQQAVDDDQAEAVGAGVFGVRRPLAGREHGRRQHEPLARLGAVVLAQVGADPGVEVEEAHQRRGVIAHAWQIPPRRLEVNPGSRRMHDCRRRGAGEHAV
jgi:hypothetical protein